MAEGNGNGTPPAPLSRFTAAGTNELMIFIVVVALIVGFVVKFLITNEIGSEMYERVVIFIVGAAIGAKATSTGIEKGKGSVTGGGGGAP